MGKGIRKKKKSGEGNRGRKEEKGNTRRKWGKEKEKE